MIKTVFICDSCGTEAEANGTYPPPFENINVSKFKYISGQYSADGEFDLNVCFPCLKRFLELIEGFKKARALAEG